MTHPTRGTCNDTTCPSHGVCHCGCGKEAKIAHQTCTAASRTRGMPAIYWQGHHPDCRNGGYMKVRGVERDRVLPLVRWLKTRYGTWRAVAEVIGLSEAGLKSQLRGDKFRFHPDSVQKIRAAVLAHRKPADPWRWMDTEEVRLPSPQDKGHVRITELRIFCGSEYGYQTHRRHNEEACDACKKAHLERVRRNSVRQSEPAWR